MLRPMLFLLLFAMCTIVSMAQDTCLPDSLQRLNVRDIFCSTNYKLYPLGPRGLLKFPLSRTFEGSSAYRHYDFTASGEGKVILWLPECAHVQCDDADECEECERCPHVDGMVPYSISLPIRDRYVELHNKYCENMEDCVYGFLRRPMGELINVEVKCELYVLTENDGTTTTTAPPPPTTRPGLIAGLAIGIFVALIVGFLIGYCSQKRKSQKSPDENGNFYAVEGGQSHPTSQNAVNQSKGGIGSSNVQSRLAAQNASVKSAHLYYDLDNLNNTRGNTGGNSDNPRSLPGVNDQATTKTANNDYSTELVNNATYKTLEDEKPQSKPQPSDYEALKTPESSVMANRSSPSAIAAGNGHDSESDTETMDNPNYKRSMSLEAAKALANDKDDDLSDTETTDNPNYERAASLEAAKALANGGDDLSDTETTDNPNYTRPMDGQS